MSGHIDPDEDGVIRADESRRSDPRTYNLAVRRNLQPSDLGDLLDRPLNASLGLHRQGGSIFLTPVWHLFKRGSFYISLPRGDRKLTMLERDPRCSLLVAENEHPYRAIEARGEGLVSTDDYLELGTAIVRRYVEAHDPGAKTADYLLDGGAIVRIEPTAIRAWDYADATYV
jgi:Pyridoxamine 5'-phosphate oxidase